MVSLTLRNIPEDLLKRIRAFAVGERRSLNSEMLVVLEEGLANRLDNRSDSSEGISSAGLDRLWGELCGSWKDNRSVPDRIQAVWTRRDGKVAGQKAGAAGEGNLLAEEVRP